MSYGRLVCIEVKVVWPGYWSLFYLAGYSIGWRIGSASGAVALAQVVAAG